jgi:hypothetical protein
MKNCIARQIIFFLIILFSDNLLFSQGKFEVSAGFGLPEYFNIKIKFGGKFQAGASFGYFRYQSFNKIFVSADCYYHFAKSEKTDLNTWYINSGITYEPTNNSMNSEEKSIFFYSRSGRSFNFTKHMGINLDLGFMSGYEWSKVYGIGPAMFGKVLSDTKEFHFYPAGSISYFFRF